MNDENLNIKKFKEHGYFVSKNLLKKETKDIKNKINTYVSDLASSNGVNIKSKNLDKKIKEAYKKNISKLNVKLGNKIYDALNRHVLIRDYLNNKKIISKVTKIFGCKKEHLLLDHIQFFLHLKNDKKNLLGWHQDSGYFRKNSTYNSITVWIPFNNCGPIDGSLWIKPGSHKKGLRSHNKNIFGTHKSQTAKKNGQVYIENLEFMNDFQVSLKSGDVLFSDYNLVHRSGIIRSDKVRITCIGRFIDTSKPFLL